MKTLAAALFALTLVTAQVSRAQYTSSNQCAGYTACTDAYGNVIGTISCQVFGYRYLQNQYGVSASNSCTWFVMPYVAVQCSGYQQTFNAYTGQYQWAWQTYSYRCPGR